MICNYFDYNTTNIRILSLFVNFLGHLFKLITYLITKVVVTYLIEGAGGRGEE